LQSSDITAVGLILKQTVRNTDLRKKELLKTAASLEETLAGVIAEHKDLLDQLPPSEISKGLQYSPEKGSEKPKQVRPVSLMTASAHFWSSFWKFLINYSKI
jgi:hypothetical protein